MTNETNTSAAARRIAGRISARSKNQEHPQDTTTAAKQRQTSFAHTDIPDSKNRLLGTTARRSTADFTQIGTVNATSVIVPHDIYEKMKTIKQDQGIAPARQMLDALRLDKDGGDLNPGDTPPRRGRGSGTGGHSVQIRVPTEEYLNIKELSHKKNLPMSQLFLSAWKRKYKWKPAKKS